MNPAQPSGWTRAWQALHDGRMRRLTLLAVLPGICMLAALACAPVAERSSPATFDPDSVPDAYHASTAALMWPGATRAFQITSDGDLYNGAWRVRVRPTVAEAPARRPKVIAYEERWRPVAHWRRLNDGVRWDFEAAAVPGPEGRDSGLVVSLQIRATNTGRMVREAGLTLDLEEPEPDAPFAAFDLPTASPELIWGSRGVTDSVLGWCASAPDGSSLAVQWSLAPGEARGLHVVLPSYPAPARSLERFARVAHSRRTQTVRDHWRSELERGTHFELGDPNVEAALKAAVVVLLSCRERRGDGWVPIGSPFHYRDVWLRDGARAAQALALAGYTHQSRELARGLIELQWPNGAFLSQRGQLDGTGQALWACAETFLRPSADPKITTIIEPARRGWEWIERQRALGRSTGERFGRMLPYADPRDNELVRAQLAGSDLWAIAGYRAAARLLTRAGHEALAARVDSSRVAYLLDTEQALAPWPDVPASWQGIGRDWGNVVACYPSRALEPGDPRMKSLARRLWTTAGGPGLCTYGGQDSLHFYLGADLGVWAMLAGARGAADSVLAATLHWRSASGGAAEIFSRTSGDYGRNLPPHPTSAAALISLIRNAVIEDGSDTLRLTLGARREWWRRGRISRAPTRWGAIDLEFAHAGDEATWSWTAVPVWTALTLPPGTRLAGPLAPPLREGPRDDVVMAPPGTREARVRMTPSGAPS
ncbi:MAG TPA: hypothetical protein VEY91_07210 [Candidatus Limnocylindria bacterium]|nr:hypothetical protein [Candidatus Limnocylindria bacterium]